MMAQDRNRGNGAAGLAGARDGVYPADMQAVGRREGRVTSRNGSRVPTDRGSRTSCPTGANHE